MGGPGSGQYAGNSNWGGGKKKKAKFAVGAGSPLMPDWMNNKPEIMRVWFRLESALKIPLTEKDSDSFGQLSLLTWQLAKFNERLVEDPTGIELNKAAQAHLRSVVVLWGKFGLTPKDAQSVMIQQEKQEEIDPLEELRGS